MACNLVVTDRPSAVQSVRLQGLHGHSYVTIPCQIKVWQKCGGITYKVGETVDTLVVQEQHPGLHAAGDGLTPDILYAVRCSGLLRCTES